MPIESVPAGSSGTYLIITASGSRYLVNYAEMTLWRMASPSPSGESALRRDGEDIEIVTMGPCTVGERLLLIVDLHVPDVAFTVRPTTTVVSIEEVQLDRP